MVIGAALREMSRSGSQFTVKKEMRKKRSFGQSIEEPCASCATLFPKNYIYVLLNGFPLYALVDYVNWQRPECATVL